MLWPRGRRRLTRPDACSAAIGGTGRGGAALEGWPAEAVRGSRRASSGSMPEALCVPTRANSSVAELRGGRRRQRAGWASTAGEASVEVGARGRLEIEAGGDRLLCTLAL